MAGCLAGWMAGWLAGWMAGWLAGCSVWLTRCDTGRTRLTRKPPNVHIVSFLLELVGPSTCICVHLHALGAPGVPEVPWMPHVPPVHPGVCLHNCLPRGSTEQPRAAQGSPGASNATCAPSTSRCVFAQRPSKVHVRSLARESQSKVMFFQHDFHRIWGFECTCVEPVSLQKPYFFPTMSWEAAAQGQKGAIFLRFCPHEGSRLVCCFSACSLGPPRSSSKPNRKHIQFLYVCKMFFLGLQTLTFFAHFVLWAAVSKISIPRNVENQIYLTHRKKRAFLALRSSLQTNCWKKLGFLQAARFDKI